MNDIQRVRFQTQTCVCVFAARRRVWGWGNDEAENAVSSRLSLPIIFSTITHYYTTTNKVPKWNLTTWLKGVRYLSRHLTPAVGVSRHV